MDIPSLKLLSILKSSILSYRLIGCRKYYAGETRLVIVSKKSIMNGDEITYNYQYFDDDLGDIPRQICSCGTSICSGTIGGRVVSSEEQKWLDRATVLLTGSKRYPLDVIRKHLEQYSDLVQVLNSKKKADRDAKIATTKRQNKRKRAESEAVNFSDISEESIFEPQEYKQLKSLLFRCDEWRTEARLYLNPEQGHYKRTLKVPALQKLLYRAPSEVKIDEYLEIKSMIERCQRLEKRDGLSNSSVLRKAFSVTRLSEPSHDNLLDESLVLKVGKNDSEKDELKTTYNILWDNFISDIKECRAIAPAFCATGVRVLQIYQSACVWANKYLIPYYLDGFISHKKDLSEYMKLVSEGKSTKDVKHLIGHLSLTLWPAIKELGLLYKISVQPDFLILCDILEENLQNYMTRIEYMNEVVNLDRPVFSEASGFSDSASEINTTPSILKKNTRKAIDDDYDPKKLFCFCWLPESACETESLIQCDNCFEWFHLPCVNMKERCSRGKGRRKFSEYFFCPLCKFDAKEPPEYLFPIKSEWLTSNALSNAYSVKMDEVIVKSEVTAALSNDKLNTTTLSEVTVVKPLNCKMATKKKSGAEKWVDLSYLLELKSVHIGELCIQDSPVWFLLNLAKKYSDEWVSLADTTILTFLSSAYDSSLSETTSPRLSLVKFLRLYYQCRVLRIRPSQIDTVRRIIWDICFDRLFSLGQDKELKSSTCPLGIEEISEILNCGTDLYQNENSDTRINDYRLLALGAFVENAERLINQASIFPSCPPSHNDKCNGYFESITKMFWSDQSVEDIREKWKDDSSKLFSSIDSLSLVLNLTASYPIVRFKSIHCKINQYVTGSENDGKVYCWCRKPDDGSSMVCCDECDFWYHSACVNYVDNKRVRKKKLILHPDASETHCDLPTDEQRDDGYVCIACCDLSGKDYKYMF